MSVEDREMIRRRVRQVRVLKRDIKENRRKGPKPCECKCHNPVKGVPHPHLGSKCPCKAARKALSA